MPSLRREHSDAWGETLIVTLDDGREVSLWGYGPHRHSYCSDEEIIEYAALWAKFHMKHQRVEA